nr:splicing factor [Tanacetum cinerariifolium]
MGRSGECFGTVQRYSLRSSSKENKKPPLAMSFERSMDAATVERKATVRKTARKGPLRYLQGDLKQITDIDFEGIKELKTNSDVEDFVSVRYENKWFVDLYVEHFDYDVMDFINEEANGVLSHGSSDEYYSSDEIEEFDDVDFHTEGEKNVVIKNLTTHGPFLNKMCGNNRMFRDYLDGLVPETEGEALDDPDDAHIDPIHKAKKGVTYPKHGPTIPWNKMTHVLGMRYEHPEQLKQALANYEVANGYQLWYAKNDWRSLLVYCGRSVECGRCAGKYSNKKKKIKKSLFPAKDAESSKSAPKSSKKGAKLTKTGGKSAGKSTKSADGWLDGCRRILGLDGCFLKHTCRGELLTAMGRDANNQMYPIAWAVVKVENIKNWSWLLSLLHDDLNLQQGTGLTLISDSHKMSLVIGCLMHSIENVQYMSMPTSKRNIKVYNFKDYSGCSSSTVDELVYTKMDDLKYINLEAYEYLVTRNPNSWCRAFFNLNVKCAAFENGISESYHKAILLQRSKPIITMLEDIRIYIMQRLVAMNKLEVNLEDQITPTVRKRLEYLKREQRLWQLSGVPCIHAVAGYMHLNRDPDEGVNFSYSQEVWARTYQLFIRPVPCTNLWKRTNNQPPLPLIVRKMPGRPRRKRVKAAGKNNSQVTRLGKQIRWSNCQGVGHNKASCENPSRWGRGPMGAESGGRGPMGAESGGRGPIGAESGGRGGMGSDIRAMGTDNGGRGGRGGGRASMGGAICRRGGASGRRSGGRGERRGGGRGSTSGLKESVTHGKPSSVEAANVQPAESEPANVPPVQSEFANVQPAQSSVEVVSVQPAPSVPGSDNATKKKGKRTWSEPDAPFRIYYKNRGRSERIRNMQEKKFKFDAQGT